MTKKYVYFVSFYFKDYRNNNGFDSIIVDTNEKIKNNISLLEFEKELAANTGKKEATVLNFILLREEEE